MSENLLIPGHDKILIREDKPESKTPGGIVIPEQSQKSTGRGIVLAKGPRVTEAQKGDIVIFNHFDATYLVLEGVELVVISEEDMLLRVPSESCGKK